MLAKRIVVFTSRDCKVEKNLNDLHNWLIECNYPPDIIERGIRNAKLQGPAPSKEKQVQLPLISTYYSNYENKTVIEVAKNLITKSKDKRIKEAFNNVKFINALRQPPNLSRQLCNSKFIHENIDINKGLFKCKDKKCKICRSYIQECKSFKTANGTMWEIRCHIDCNSINVIYYLICNACNNVTYTGKTDDLRARTNNHITGCRHGKGSNKFDNHVFSCMKSSPINEPYFKLFAYLKLSDYQKLRGYENMFHRRNYDTMNR